MRIINAKHFVRASVYGRASRPRRIMTRFTIMGDKIANQKKQAKRSAKPTEKAPMTVAEIKTATPRK